MNIEIVVPQLGESVSEATIIKWHKKIGDQVSRDELILELETEKVTLEVNASASGVVCQIMKQNGDNVAVGDVIGYINENSDKAIIPDKSSLAKLEKTSPTALVTDNDISKLPPSVQKLATENNIEQSTLVGTGKLGRVTKGDVLKKIDNIKERDQSSLAPIPEVATPLTQTDDDENIKQSRVKMSRLRQTIAQRLKDSQNTAAILTTFNEIDMSNVMSLRQKYREAFEKKHKTKLGFMSFFVKAVVYALKQVPAVNARIEGDYIIYNNFYDIGIAVGTEQGLIVPVLRKAQDLSFAGIEGEIVALSQKAKDGKLAMQDLVGGTFTITNGGVYGSLLSTPIINPPQSGIIGLHKIQERPMAIDGKIEVRPMMYVALSYDHRIIDGREAVIFLVKVKEAIENPERMFLDI